MGYLNPLLQLPAGRALLELPPADRRRIANTEAEKSWAKRKGPMAAYSSPWARLVANVSEDERGCWIGCDPSDPCGYQRVCFWIPLIRKHRKVTAHVATWVLRGLDRFGWGTMATANDLWLACLELHECGDELDHTCENPRCRNPAHLVQRTPYDHRQVTSDRKAARRETREALADDFVELEF